MEKNLIDIMVDRFLCWKLPNDFAPDCGINFDGRQDDGLNKNKTWPVGTNLLTAEQAKQMFEHCLGLSEECDHEWIANTGRGGEPDFRLNRRMFAPNISRIPQHGPRARLYSYNDQL